ncbi:hypothetical protein C1631_011960 [Chryseobacterium phosphatilyticum]|uniref:Uncharacterized protein n=1 Tax=Chryseobacterium phosphatilyticum TaxID=475075 RepID=A0A316XAW6_9FLAO|nr:hypothetical protein [Chryseobacterium phosphatilyticum]PWN70664.1 hypothetical protein C1631_011960 [Chryseobacterium phosphatilyticum]
MEKTEFQIIIHLLFLIVMAGSSVSSCKNSTKKPSPATKTLKQAQYLIPVHNNKINEMKLELIGGY